MILRLGLARTLAIEQGVFGVLKGPGLSLFTLEHGYSVGDWWEPKVAPGTYTCRRHPPQRLNYETFMLEGVPDFQGSPVSGILIHCGNFDEDSAGCILVGAGRENHQLTQSRAAFKQLMELLKDQDSFELEIS